MIPLVPFLTRCLVLVAAFLTVSVTAQTPLAITDFRVDLAGRAVVRVPSEAGFYFILYRGDEITAIQAATDVESLPSAGDPPSVELIDARPPTPLPSRFYRVERVPLGAPKDADADGIDDVFELNSRPLLDPLNPADAALDPDNDGRSTLEEYRAGTNPFVANPAPAPASPRFSSPVSSTTGGRLELTGFGTANTYIRVEGGAALATNRVGADGAFMVSVPLSTNRINRLFVTAVNPQGNTSPGVPIEILQDSQPPTLHVDFPTNRMTFTTANTLVAGRVGDSLSGYAGLAVWVHASPAEGNPPLASTSFPPNSPYQATVDVGIGPNGTYERADVPLVEGTNIVSVVAMDALGNRTVRRAEVIRRPLVGPRLVMRSGDRQMTNVLRRLEQPLAVRAENPDGSPIPNVLLTLDVTRSDGRLLPANTNALASDWTLQPNATTNGAMVIQVRTDANGEAAAWWTLGSEAGCANNRVCVTSGTLDACVYFCASAMGNPGRQINIGSGNHQRVETGGATVEPLRAWVSDGLNPAARVPVTFRVVEGNGRLVEGGRDGSALASTSPRPAGAGPEGSSLTVATGRTGHASVGFVAGSDAGQNVIEASFPGQFGLPATFIVYGVARDLTQPATFTGLILDNTSCPIGNAYCELEVAHYKVGTFSDGQGRFRFENVPGGMGHLHVNGRTATSVFTNTIPTNSFPALHYSVTTVPNAENSLPSPVLLPRLNPTNAHVYDGTKDLVLTCEGIDGLKMTIRANSMRDPQGNPVTPANPMVVSLDQVHHDDVPMPMPDGVAPAFAWTLQPGGATFDPPVTIEYPNMSGLPPGSIAYFLSFNHDTERFEIVSSGHITNDGSTIVTDPGSGLTLAGWGCNCPPYAVTGSCDTCPESSSAQALAGLHASNGSTKCQVCQSGSGPDSIKKWSTTIVRDDDLVTKRNAGLPLGKANLGEMHAYLDTREFDVSYVCDEANQVWRLRATSAHQTIIIGENLSYPHYTAEAVRASESCDTLKRFKGHYDYIRASTSSSSIRLGEVVAEHEMLHATRTVAFFETEGNKYLAALSGITVPFRDATTSEAAYAKSISDANGEYSRLSLEFQKALYAFILAEHSHGPEFALAHRRGLVNVRAAIEETSIRLGCGLQISENSLHSQSSLAEPPSDGSPTLDVGVSPIVPRYVPLKQLLGSDWSLSIGGQFTSTPFVRATRVQNIVAADQFGLEGSGTPPDLISDDSIRLIGIKNGSDGIKFAFSEHFQLRQGRTYSITNLTFTDIPPRVPDALSIVCTNRTVRIGQSTPLQVYADFADKVHVEVTSRSAWTSYRVSNPRIATISREGVVKPLKPGVVFVTAVNEGATAVCGLNVVTGDDGIGIVQGTAVDQNGLPVAGARIRLYNLQVNEATSDQSGRFELYDVPTKLGAVEGEVLAFIDGQLMVAAIRVEEGFFGGLAQLGKLELRPIKFDQQRLTAGTGHSLAIRTNGSLYGWGHNNWGQLGIGSSVSQFSPVGVSTNRAWALVTSARDGGHTVAIADDGTMWTWGENTEGQLGDSSRLSFRTSPVQIATNQQWATASAGSDHTLAVSRDGSLWAWGASNSSRVPLALETNRTFRAVSAGSHYSMALAFDGTLWGWGYNSRGQLGDLTRETRSRPIQVATNRLWKAVSAGNAHTMAIALDGTLWGWGDNSGGEFGDGTQVGSLVPRLVDTNRIWTAVAAGQGFTLALDNEGRIWGSGGNSFGVLGDGTYTYRPRRVEVRHQKSWEAISVGLNHALALARDGSLWAWGRNEFGALGSDNRNVPMPVQIATNRLWIAVTAGIQTTLAVDREFRLWELGRINPDRRFPIASETNRAWKVGSVGQIHMVALAMDESLWSRGGNHSGGLLGDGTIVSRDSWARVQGNEAWTAVSAAPGYTLAITAAGALWGWGDPSGEFVNPIGGNIRRVPVAIETNRTWSSISAGGSFGLGITGDGALWTWRLRFSDKPTPFATNRNWMAVSCGRNFALALASDRSLWAWGENESGQLGDGTTTSRYDPVRVVSEQTWTQISASRGDEQFAGLHAFGLASDGSLWGWGWNDYGQLGDGTVVSRRSPVRVGDANDWVSVSATVGHTLALKKDGTLWGWGRNTRSWREDFMIEVPGGPVWSGIQKVD